MNEEQTQRWVALVHEDKVATSTAFMRDLDWLEVSRYVLHQNFLDAIQIPDAIERNISLTLQANREHAWFLHREFVRRPHNYLAAAKTVVDHMRALRVRWSAPEFAEQYHTRLAVLMAEPVVKFIQDLRRLAQHSKLPPVSRVITFDPVPPGPNTVHPRLRLMVNAHDLLELCDWSTRAREYVRAAADRESIDMTLAVKQYHQLVIAFDGWCVEQIKAGRKDLLDDFDLRRAEIIGLSSGT